MGFQQCPEGCDHQTEDCWYGCQSLTAESPEVSQSVGTECPAGCRYVLGPLAYLHVLDETTGCTRLEIGPQRFITQRNERVTLGPESMVVVPPAHYCIIESPVLRTNGCVSSCGRQALLRHGDTEVRLHQPPFPLYPGEKLTSSVLPLPVVAANQALRLRALRDFTDGNKVRVAGEEWLFGRGAYVPRPEVAVVAQVDATIIGADQALRLRALQDTTDKEGRQRAAGDEWLVKEKGAYIPDVSEEVMEVVTATIIGANQALRLRALRDTTDRDGRQRATGDEWLVEQKRSYIPDVSEEVVELLEPTALTSRQYCVVRDPIVDGKPQFGQRRILKGPMSFFVQPGETLEGEILDIYLLLTNEALVLVAGEDFTDETVSPAVSRKSGDCWMVRGPASFVPPLETEVLRRHSAIPLCDTEGVYVRNTATGEVRAVIGKPYLLTEDEELWSKELPSEVEKLLDADAPGAGAGTCQRDKTRVVTYFVPKSSAVLIENCDDRTQRDVFGPELVMLQPKEQFSVFSLSAGLPLMPDKVRSLTVPVGPEILTGVIAVETSDHVRLSLTIAVVWRLMKDGTLINLFPLSLTDNMWCVLVRRLIRAVSLLSHECLCEDMSNVVRAAALSSATGGTSTSNAVVLGYGAQIIGFALMNVERCGQPTEEPAQKRHVLLPAPNDDEVSIDT